MNTKWYTNPLWVLIVIIAFLLLLAIVAWGGLPVYLTVVAVMILAIAYRVRKALRGGDHERKVSP